MEKRLTLEDFSKIDIFNLSELMKMREDIDCMKEYLSEEDRLLILKLKCNKTEKLVTDNTTFVRESYFTIYCKELLKQKIEEKNPRYVVVDWQSTANEFRSFYAKIKFSFGVFYYRPEHY